MSAASRSMHVLFMGSCCSCGAGLLDDDKLDLRSTDGPAWRASMLEACLPPQSSPVVTSFQIESGSNGQDQVPGCGHFAAVLSALD